MELGKLTTEARNPASEGIDRLSALEIVRLMNAEDARVPAAVGAIAEPIAEAIEIIANRLGAGGRLVYLGAGTSGRLGVLDASECPPTFNSPPWQVVGLIAGGPTALTRAVEGAEDHPELAVEDLQKIQLDAGDVLVGIATSGRTPYVLGGLQHARTVGAYAIGLSCNPQSELAAVADLMLTPVVGPEVLSGSTRLKAGTATKLILNMLTTGAMVRLGKTYGNLMVDLQATNRKLTDRSRRIVSMLTDIPADAAAAVLERSGGDVKTAVVVQRRAVSPEMARRLLQQSGGRLREALERAVPADLEAARSADPRTLVLGVDGGGSKTLAWLAESGETPQDGRDAEILQVETSRTEAVQRLSPVGVGEAGPSNPQSAGWAAALANLDRAVQRAFAAAGRSRDAVAAACLAIAGMGREPDQERLRAWAVQRQLADQILIVHDALPVLAAGTATMTGVALICGTGSLAFGRTKDGRTARAGGWGYVLGDEGSGYDIAREGLRAAALALDGRGPHTLLAERFLAALGSASASEFVRDLYRRADDRQWLASLAQVVLTTAIAGDAVADELVQSAAVKLAGLINAVSAKLGEAPRELALGGGLLLHSELLQSRVISCLNVTAPVGLVPEPVAGAVILARRALQPAS